MNRLNTLFQEGLIQHQQGNTHKAKKIYESIIDIDPKHFNALFFLGLAEAQASNRNRAILLFSKAIEANPNSPECYFNLATAFKEDTRLEEALKNYNQSILLNHNYGEAYYNRGLVLTSLNSLGEAAKSYQMVQFTGCNSNIKFAASVYLSVLNYLNSDFQASEGSIKQYQSQASEIGQYFPIEKAYYDFITKLLAWRKSNKIINKSDKYIYVIGESHALSYHDIQVIFENNYMVCKSSWIAGCKQWHLGSLERNVYKNHFMSIASQIPVASTVVLTIGEIDCRINDGILNYCNKYPENDVREIALTTIESYLKFILQVTGNANWRVIIQGVPFPNLGLLDLMDEDRCKLTEFISFFNRILRSKALDYGFGFLDVHALTSGKSEKLNNSWHLDLHHLSPSAIGVAFENYFTQSQIS
jgi:Tetratricopeptide repeat